MDLVRFMLGGVLPYVAVVVFIVATAHRIYTWKRLAAPSMTLFPAPADDKANKKNVLKEALLFRSLFGGDRVLWGFAWVFHVVLLLIFVGHLRVFTNVDSILMTAGMSAEAIQAMSGGVGGAAGVVILVATVLLLARRLALPRVREITGAADILALLLIGAIIVTGNMMRFGAEHFDLALTREYFANLATFGGVTGQAALQNEVFMVHMVLAFLLIMVIPFSKILHFGGIFFTHELVRKH
ncbi:MAG: respiratory nitrate reductase subunit gamma [Gemmatimonadota bacterium]|nr:MAG: respiratory nitrate reductase subunit gamma [Gemmatimonadota bacterium]